MNLLLQLPSLGTSANTVAAPDKIGLIVIAIIVVPVIALIIISIFDAPRTFRVPSLFVGSLILLFGAVIFVFAILGAVLGFIVPQ